METESIETSSVKSKNQLKNEAKRNEKLAKLQAKQAKLNEEKIVQIEKQSSTTKDKVKKYANDAVEIEVVPLGEKKDTSKPLVSSYSPKQVEASWYAWWEKEGFFKPEYPIANAPGTGENYVIAMPPPNVTGSLHLGHSMMASIEDSLVRFNRMRGNRTLYVPGCDHAGIATQVVVEKKIKKELNLSRHELGREKFIERVWEWKQQYGDRIYKQLKRIGVSSDWNRACFTMDSKFAMAVSEAFTRLYKDGLIFRDNRFVYWSAAAQTSLSDLEVESIDVPVPTYIPVPGYEDKRQVQFGLIYHFAYPMEDSADGEIVVATTRPETIFGDVAIAVNPKNPRYLKLHGKFAVHPFNGKRIPIIQDDYADMELGTGAVKITPAHDPNDFILGKRHKLPFINIFDENNVLNEHCGSFCGMKRFDARTVVLDELVKKGLFKEKKAHPMVISKCSRSGDIIEPRLKPQWWLNCKEMARKSVEAVKNGDLQLIPKESEKEWFHWLENIQDWCLSRQLWWGHRIPVYHVNFKGEAPNPDSKEFWICASSLEDAIRIAGEKFIGKEIVLTQDEDVLDTWFSSGLWPFGILGWPNKTEDFVNFFPNTILETGKDILFFWVARMVMLSLHLLGTLPFKTILLHSIVRDAQGRKMSKSLGNVIDPIDIIEGISLEQLHQQLYAGNLDPKEIELAKKGQKKDFPIGIPECGSDALRFGLCACTSLSRDVNLDILRIEGYRRFCNKIWNATKFALMKLENWSPSTAASYKLCGKEGLMDLWILHRLDLAIEKVISSVENYNFMAATTAIFNFWMYELCDVYIEGIKPACDGAYGEERKKICQEILYECLDSGLKILHPFMPFLTEELWQRLPKHAENTTKSIMVSAFPVIQCDRRQNDAVCQFDFILDVVKGIRSACSSEFGTKRIPSAKIEMMNAENVALLSSNSETILTLVRNLSNLAISDASECGSFDSLEGQEIVPS